jgi:CBS domain-containing protein
MSPPISSMMQTQVLSVGMDDTVGKVEEFMREHDLSWVPVDEPRGTVVGTVTAADLLQFHVRRGDPAATAAWQICTYKPIVVAPQASVSDVARQMLRHKAHHVVVMENERIVGVVSSLDFVRQLT